MKASPIADALDDAAARLLASVEAAMAPSTLAVPLRRTMARLPALMNDLIGRLREDRLDEPVEQIAGPVRFDIVAMVSALRLLRDAIYALMDERQVPLTARDVRNISGWFSAISESALLAENNRFGEMLDAIPDHLLLYQADGFLINYVNKPVGEGAKQIAGMTREEVLGHRIVDIVHDKNFGRYVEDCLRRTVEGELITDEFIYPSPDGGRWHEQHMRPVYGANGKVDSIVITSRDIHDRKKAQARLQLLSKLGVLAESMDDERIIDEMAHLSIPELADWCLTTVVESTKLSRATLAHRDPAKAALSHELLTLPSELHRLRVGAAALSGESTLIVQIDKSTEHTDLVHTEIVKRLGVRSALVVPIVVMGSTVAIATFMMTSESGRLYGPEDLVLAEEMARRAEQIIENARLHQQLRQSEGRFRFALDHASISVFETDTALRFRWNHNSILGLAGGNVVGQTLSDVVSREVGEVVDQLPRQVIETGQGARRSFASVINGKQRHFMVRYEPLRSGREVVGVSGATIDITDLKETEEQLARELAFRERMIGVLGHDLRNPVSAVLGFTRLIANEQLSDKASKQLGHIEQAALRMNEMIGTLLDFTRLRFHGSLPIALDNIDFAELARNIVTELQAAHRDREIALSINGSLRGRWDPGRMSQLFTNLVVNALTHGTRGSPVSISVVGESQEVVVGVSNRGPTIKPEIAERIFEPFKQGDDREGRARLGLGLGLFIVREIARAHGGTVCVHSDDGLVTFTAKLPRTVKRDVVLS
jgi:PAS domain S-box-containing protein